MWFSNQVLLYYYSSLEDLGLLHGSLDRDYRMSSIKKSLLSFSEPILLHAFLSCGCREGGNNALLSLAHAATQAGEPIHHLVIELKYHLLWKNTGYTD